MLQTMFVCKDLGILQKCGPDTLQLTSREVRFDLFVEARLFRPEPSQAGLVGVCCVYQHISFAKKVLVKAVDESVGSAPEVLLTVQMPCGSLVDQRLNMLCSGAF